MLLKEKAGAWPDHVHKKTKTILLARIFKLNNNRDARKNRRRDHDILQRMLIAMFSRILWESHGNVNPFKEVCRCDNMETQIIRTVKGVTFKYV